MGGTNITDAQVVELAGKVRQAAEGLLPTFFEVVTAISFLHFKNSGVKWAVIETGLGGRLDATNASNSVLSVITNVSIEHTGYLGKTVERIAKEKAGIIKQKGLVVTGAKGKALSVIRNACKSRNARLIVAKNPGALKQHARQSICSRYR